MPVLWNLEKGGEGLSGEAQIDPVGECRRKNLAVHFNEREEVFAADIFNAIHGLAIIFVGEKQEYGFAGFHINPIFLNEIGGAVIAALDLKHSTGFPGQRIAGIKLTLDFNGVVISGNRIFAQIVVAGDLQIIDYQFLQIKAIQKLEQIVLD